MAATDDAATPPPPRLDVEAQLLLDMSIKYTVRDSVPLAQIDVPGSIRNQARMGDLDEPTVIQYIEALKAGHVLPPIVGNTGKSGIIIRSGRHRYESYTRLERTIPQLYLCDPTTSVRRLLEFTFRANVGAGHGLTPDEEARIQQAHHLIENGMSSVQAAALLLLPHSKLERYRAELEAKRRAITAGVSPKEWDELSKLIRVKLNAIHTDEGFVSAVKLTVDAGLTMPEVTDIVNAINTTRSGEAQKQNVDDLRNKVYKKRITEGGNSYVKRQGIRSTPRTAAEAALSRLLNVAPITTLMEYYPEADRKDTLQRVDEVITFLKTFKEALNK